MLNNIRAGTPVPLYQPTQAAPFDELKLKKSEIPQHAATLKKNGYFTIPMSNETAAFLQRKNRLDKPAWESKSVGNVIDFKKTSTEKTITEVANDIAEELTGKPSALTPQEFELRRPMGKGADKWHQDKEPKKVVCIATVEGSGTEFIKPNISEKIFKKNEFGHLIPTAEVEKNIQQAKSDRFYFFAANGIKADDVPKLVHRSPPEIGRSIFIARWA